jgi:phosphoribosylformylglycinamidine cyclo-ligase
MKLTQEIIDLGMDAAKLVLSPTRTYAPVIKKILEKYRSDIHGMIHCSGGGQTKVLHFVNDLHVIKDNMFPVPPVFRLIQEQSETSWEEMYKVFNMGHRFEIYISPELAPAIINISREFSINAQIIGHCEKMQGKKLSIHSEYGVFDY